MIKFPLNLRKNRLILISLLSFLILASLIFYIQFLIGFGRTNIAFGTSGGTTTQGIVECKQTPCGWIDFSNTLSRLLRSIVSFSFWVAVVLSVIGSFMIMFGGVKVDNYQKGKSMIMIAIVGYSLILLSGVIFDIILDFFQPKFLNLNKFVLASSDLRIDIYYKDLKDSLTKGLKCGGPNVNSPIEKIIGCAFEAISSLSSLAVIFLGIAIFISAAYLISTPLFGLANIPKAWQIMVWSIIGLIIVLLAQIIGDQIKRIITFENHFVFAQENQTNVESKKPSVNIKWIATSVKVCPPSIFGAEKCNFPSIEEIASKTVNFIIDRLAPPLLVLLIIIGGFFYLLSPFNLNNIQTGHNYIKWAVYGYVILLLITSILSVISVFLGGSSP